MRLSVALLIAGCADSRSAVHGSIVYRYPDGTTIPVDLTTQRFQAYVLREQGFVAYPHEPVAGRADGTFEIPDVPDEPFVLRRSSDGFYGVFSPHGDHAITETWDVLGRPGAAPAAAPTMIELDASGLAAWQRGDTLFVDCFGTASEVVDPELTPSLAAGATAIHASFDWATGASWGAGGVPYLMDGSAGDQLVIARAATHDSGGLRMSAVTQVLVAPAPTQVEGQPSRVAGAFTAVPATAQLAASVPGDRLATMLDPGLAAVDQGVQVIAGPAADGSAGLGPELVRISTHAAAAPMIASTAYGNPFPDWQPRITGWYLASRHLDAGHRGPLDIPFAAFTDSRPLAGDPFALDPLAPVANATLDGMPIAGQTVRVPPHQPLRLDFDHPAEATRGRVIVWRVDKGLEAAYVEIARAPVELPIDIFQAGGRYAFQIDVFADDGDRTRTASTFTDAITIVSQ